MYLPGVWRLKEDARSLGLELQLVRRCLCKISQWSQTLSHLSSPKHINGLARWLSGWRCFSQGWLSWGTTGGREGNWIWLQQVDLWTVSVHIQTHTQICTHNTHAHRDTYKPQQRTHRKTYTHKVTQKPHTYQTADTHACTFSPPHTCAHTHMHMLTCTYTYAIHIHLYTH